MPPTPLTIATSLVASHQGYTHKGSKKQQYRATNCQLSIPSPAYSHRSSTPSGAATALFRLELNEAGEPHQKHMGRIGNLGSSQLETKPYITPRNSNQQPFICPSSSVKSAQEVVCQIKSRIAESPHKNEAAFPRESTKIVTGPHPRKVLNFSNVIQINSSSAITPI